MSDQFTGFAVFDLETTGLSPGRHHRVVEIGIVRLDENLEVVERWETLVNPERDIGAHHIHGITAGDVKDAPVFSQIAGDVWHRFESAIPVAHNLSFDRRFLVAEMARAGVNLDYFDGICTMRMAEALGLSGGNRKLVELCRYLGISVGDAHSAGNDALMCAEILQHISRETDLTTQVRTVSCEELWRKPATPLGITRQKARQRPVGSPLQQLASRVSGRTIQVAAGQDTVDEYLLTLDRVLEDRVVDPEEVEELSDLALACGFSSEDVAQIHHKYIEAIVAIVLSDGVVTVDEMKDLGQVSGLLGVDWSTIELQLKQPPAETKIPLEDLSGKTVCFTGDLCCRIQGELIDRETAEAYCKESGLEPVGSVTKKLDILVVADPDSQSGKAKKARQYGIRIIAEHAFWRKLGFE